MKHLLQEVRYVHKANDKHPVPKIINVPKNIAPIEKPDKQNAIETMKTRFIHTT